MHVVVYWAHVRVCAVCIVCECVWCAWQTWTWSNDAGVCVLHAINLGLCVCVTYGAAMQVCLRIACVVCVFEIVTMFVCVHTYTCASTVVIVNVPNVPYICGWWGHQLWVWCSNASHPARSLAELAQH